MISIGLQDILLKIFLNDVNHTCGVFTSFEFQFEFVLKYGNKRTIKPYMAIHQIKSWSIFVSKSTRKGKKVRQQKSIGKSATAYKKLPQPNVRPWQSFCRLWQIFVTYTMWPDHATEHFNESSQAYEKLPRSTNSIKTQTL